METMWALANWRRSLESVDPREFLAGAFDDLDDRGRPFAYDILTEDEATAVCAAYVEVRNAVETIERVHGSLAIDAETFMATGWPQRIAPLADRTLRLMLTRGRFREDQEEDRPSLEDGWPWHNKYKR